MSKMDMITKMVNQEKKDLAVVEKRKQEWLDKPLEAFTTSQVDGEYNFVMPVISITQAGGLDVFITVPKFEGLHSRIRMSIRSKDGRPSEVARYKATAEYRAGLISCYTTQKNTKEGNRILHWHGLRLINLDDVRDIAITQAPRVQGPTTLIREQ